MLNFLLPRKEDQQQEDHRSSPENIVFTELILEEYHLFKVQDIHLWKPFILGLIAYYTSLCLPSIENTSDFQPVTSTTASAQDSQAANVSPNNNSLDGFTDNIGRFTLRLTERLKQSKNDENSKTSLFTFVMGQFSKLKKIIIPSVDPDGQLQSLLNDHQKKHCRKEKQYAFAIVYFKDGKSVRSPSYYPCHSTKTSHSDSNTGDTLHSEESLHKYLDNFFQNNGANVQLVLIYTHNSPCTKREKAGIEPCMFLLRRIAH